MFRQWLHDRIAARHPGVLFDVLVPPDPAMGDYSTNIALVAAKHAKRNPKELAQDVCDDLLAEGQGRIARCEVAGPGFVNIFLDDAWLQKEFVSEGDVQKEGHDRTVIVEYGSLNAAKVPHIGHIRSVIIGDALARVYKALAYTVVRWDYPGDWGVQYGQIIAQFKKGEEPVQSVAAMEQLYVQFHKEAADDKEVEAEGRAEFKKLEDGDQENRALWERFRELALAEHASMYETLGVTFDVRKGEAEYEKDLPGVIDMLLDAGLAKESEGALIVPLEQFSLPPGLVRKSDGGTLYLTRDVASLEDRIQSYTPAKVLYVVANQQALHLEQLFATAELIKQADGITEPLPELMHVKYGLVLGAGGKKFSSREGNVMPLGDVLSEAVRRADEVVREKNPELSDTERADVARVVGIGAVKYNDLRQHPHTDIVFDWDAMLDLGGNSGPYIQYTHARLRSILAKAGSQGGADRSQLTHPAERSLMRHLMDFGWAVSQSARHYALNGLALYVYELAEKANRFYEQVRINDDDNAERKSARLELIAAVADRLSEGLALLGIHAPDRI